MLVCLDVGHGGKDPGNIGPTGAREKDQTLDIALKTRDILKKFKIDVVLTRDTDKTLEEAERIRIINSSGASIIVSIHTNAGPPGGRGAETFFSINSPAGKGDKLAKLILSNVCLYTKLTSRGAKTRASTKHPGHDYYYILDDTRPTAVIIENGFNSNILEEMLLKQDKFRYHCAKGIARGIVEYFGLKWVEPENMAKPAEVTATKLNIRVMPTTAAALIPGGKQQYIKGEKIDVFEVVNDWGKTKLGWVNLNYIKYI